MRSQCGGSSAHALPHWPPGAWTILFIVAWGSISMTDGDRDDRIEVTSMHLPDSGSHIPFADQVPGVVSHVSMLVLPREHPTRNAHVYGNIGGADCVERKTCQPSASSSSKDAWVKAIILESHSQRWSCSKRRD